VNGLPIMRIACFFLMLLVLAACAMGVRVSPGAFQSAERAIAAAEQAGAGELAPVELRFAREKLEFAHKGVEKRKFDVSLYLVEESEINSELAIEKSRTAKLRRKVNELRRSNELLREKLEANYGEAFE
jgi:hypothetical protein